MALTWSPCPLYTYLTLQGPAQVCDKAQANDGGEPEELVMHLPFQLVPALDAMSVTIPLYHTPHTLTPHIR